MRSARSISVLAAVALCLGGVAVALLLLRDDDAEGATPAPKRGGIVRVVARNLDVGPLDPALEYTLASALLVDTTCLRLAEAAPPARVSPNRKTYTFTLRGRLPLRRRRLRAGKRLRAGDQPHARTRHEVSVGAVLRGRRRPLRTRQHARRPAGAASARLRRSRRHRSAPSLRRCPSIPRASAPIPPPARTPSPSTGPPSES